MLGEDRAEPAQVQNFRSPAGAARRQPGAAPGPRRAHAARGADLADRLGPLRDAVAAFPVRAEERRARCQPVEGRAGTERAPARRRAGGFRRQGRDHPCPAGSGRHALRARAGARHQILARHRACRRHRPLDERDRRPRRRRSGPQRHRHRAAQRQARDRLSARDPGQPRFRDDQGQAGAGARQDHQRRGGHRRHRQDAAPAGRRHHRLGQVGGDQHDDPVAALPHDAAGMPADHDRPEDAGTLGL